MFGSSKVELKREFDLICILSFLKKSFVMLLVFKGC